MEDEPRQEIRRIVFNGEQYVAYQDIIDAVKQVADDFWWEEYYDTFEALLWFVDQLEFSMIVDNFRMDSNEQE